MNIIQGVIVGRRKEVILMEKRLEINQIECFYKDGNFVSSGAQYNESGGVNAGHVKIYKWNSGSWGGTGYEWEIIGQPDANFGVTNF